MKYTLLLGIEFEFYKKPAQITVSVDKKFVDTFKLDQNLGCTEDAGKMFEQRWYEHFACPHVIDGEKRSVPKFFKIYEINEEYLRGDLEIQVQNSNSDFSNGFLKNSSKIKFTVVALFPSHFTKNQGETLMSILLRLNEAYLRKYLSRRTELQRKSIDKTRYNKTPWPGIEHFNISRENQIYEKDGRKSSFWWIGGDFTAYIPIRKKHKIYFLKDVGAEDKGFIRCEETMPLAVGSYKPLLNIYDEDQRNSD